MSEQPDVEAVTAWFMERQRLLFEVIEGARYDFGEHVEALREVVADLEAGQIGDAVELLEHEIASAEALMVQMPSADLSLRPPSGEIVRAAPVSSRLPARPVSPPPSVAHPLGKVLTCPRKRRSDTISQPGGPSMGSRVRARALASFRQASLLATVPLLLTSWSATPALALTIGGKVTYYKSAIPVPGVIVDVEGASVASATTDASGQFSLVGVPDSIPITLHPHKKNGFGDAISTGDGISVLMFVVGLTSSLTPEEVLACDVTGNKKVNAIDAVRILQFAVGMSAQTPVGGLCNSDWVFVPNPTFVPTQTTSAPIYSNVSCTHEGEIAYGALATDVTGQDFVGLLLGDCNADWVSDCPAGMMLCGDTCVDLNTNNDHCGKCEQACGVGTCNNRNCDCPASYPMLCLGGCRDPNDGNSCGKCKTICIDPMKCKSQKCQCKDGYSDACGGCKDIANSIEACGTSCTNCQNKPFPFESVCKGGKCECKNPSGSNKWCPGGWGCMNTAPNFGNCP